MLNSLPFIFHPFYFILPPSAFILFSFRVRPPSRTGSRPVVFCCRSRPPCDNLKSVVVVASGAPPGCIVGRAAETLRARDSRRVAALPLHLSLPACVF